MASIKIDNNSVVNGSWGSVNKTELGQKLSESKDNSAIREAYLFVGDVEKRSTWKFPHHVLAGDTLKVHIGGVHSAAQRLVSSGETETDIPKSAAAKHLLKHYRVMKETPPESLTDLSRSLTIDQLENYITNLELQVSPPEDLDEEIEELKEVLTDMKKDIFEIAKSKGLEEKLVDEDCSRVEQITLLTKAHKHIKSIDDLYPDDEELELINRMAMMPMKKEQVIVLDGYPTSKEMDDDHEHMTMKALNSFVNQAVNTPLIMDHNRSLHSRMPVGMTMLSEMKNGGVHEKYAIPLTDYNKDVVTALLNGSVNKLSIGALTKPSNRVCDSCDKSIFDRDCPHIPGRVDEKGNLVTVSIKDIDRVLERSLVNAPALKSASIGRKPLSKDLSDEGLIEEFSKALDNFNLDTIVIDNETIEDSKSMDNDIVTEQKEDVQQVVGVSSEAVTEAISKAQDETLAKVEEVSKAVDDKTSAVELQVKSLDEVCKTQAAQVDKLLSFVEKQVEILNQVMEMQKQIASDVAAAMQISKDEILEKLQTVPQKQEEVKKAITYADLFQPLNQ